MSNFYRIILLFIIFVFLSTFNPQDLNPILKTNKTLFKIQTIDIKNNFLITKSEVEEKLINIYKKNIFFLKKEDIEKPLKEISFLEKIEVKKKYPDTIIIEIFETKPLAILFKEKNKYILDNLGNVINYQNISNFGKLPSVFGDGAENNFINFYDELKKENFPISKIKSFYFFQIDRWDLELLNNMLVKFPNNKRNNSIAKSIELLNRKDFINYKIIDLRIEGKIIVE
tara:strand:- start:416 stop:1099 length:684 start_codon:yes stop_codon:yes gene_type:complete